jgi:hypothetical protein
MFRLEADGELYNSMLSGILNPESWMENTGDVDNWALMGDGTLVKDKDGWLKDENGMYINKDGSRSWQVTDKTIGAKDIVTGLLNILNEGTSKIPYTEFSDSQIEKVHALLTNSGFVHSEGDMRDVKWDEGNDNASIPFSNIINGGFGDSVAPAVFINGYDVSTDMLLFGDGNEWESIHTNIPDYVYNRYIDLAATKGLFYNTIQALVGGETRISWPYKKESDKDLYINYNNYHYGIDIAGQEGLPVYAGISGKITDVTGLHEREGYSVRIEYGYQFEGFTHTTGITGEYLHLQNKSDAVIGQFVSAGTQIGKLGNTGSVSTGPHLHYTVFTKPGQTYATNVALRIFGKDYMDTAMPNKPPNNIPSTKTVYDGTSFYERYRSKYQK